MSEPLVFYDIRSSLPLEQRSWTLFILRIRLMLALLERSQTLTRLIRLALNYKQIPYKTVWVEFADVQAVGQRIGATPSTAYPDGTPRYTLPTIYDPNTGRTVSDSVAIAKYLDEQYPERRLFPDGTEHAQEEFANSAIAVVGSVRLALILWLIFMTRSIRKRFCRCMWLHTIAFCSKPAIVTHLKS
jgi:glutathione S-transferase